MSKTAPPPAFETKEISDVTKQIIANMSFSTDTNAALENSENAAPVEEPTDNPMTGLVYDEPSDTILDDNQETDLNRDLMRPDLHGVYVLNKPEVRNDYERRKYKVAKAGSGWLLREDSFTVNDKGELTYGDCVIMVVTKAAYERLMAAQDARRKQEMQERGGELRLTKGPVPPPDPD